MFSITIARGLLIPFIKVAFWDPHLLRIVYVNEMIRSSDLVARNLYVLSYDRRALDYIGCRDNFFLIKVRCLYVLGL